MPMKKPSKIIRMRIFCQSLILCSVFLLVAIVPATLSSCGGLTDTAQQIEAVSADGQSLKLNLICQKVFAPQLPNQGSPFTSFESSDNLDQLMDKIKKNNSGLELTFDRITDRQFAIWAYQDGKTAFYTISKYVTQDQPAERYLFSASVLRLEETDKHATDPLLPNIVLFPYDLVEPFRELSWGYRQAIETTASAVQFIQFYEMFAVYRVESLDDGFVLHADSADQTPLRFQFKDNHLTITPA